MSKDKCQDVVLVVNAYASEIAADFTCDPLGVCSVGILYIKNDYANPHSGVLWQKTC